MSRVSARLFKLQGFKEGDSTIFGGPRESLEMGGARKALTSWIILGTEFKCISFKSSEKKQPLGSFSVRKDVSTLRFSPPGKGRGQARWGLSAEPIGQQQTKYRHASLWCQAQNKG